MLARHKYDKVVSRKYEWHKSVDDILNSAVAYRSLLRNWKYVYFLIDGYEIVYVGMSDNLQIRLGSHTKDKVFDKVSFIKVNKDDQKYIEAYYISTLRPKYNKFIPVRDKK